MIKNFDVMETFINSTYLILLQHLRFKTSLGCYDRDLKTLEDGTRAIRKACSYPQRAPVTPIEVHCTIQH